jgi:hypothetical protein
MITHKEAQRMILKEWRSWLRTKNIASPTGTDAFVFFGNLQQHKPHLLTFSYSGDKWERVQGWLLNARLVST